MDERYINGNALFNFIIIDDRWWASVIMVQLSDHLLMMSSFSVRMSPSLDHMHPVFADAFSI